MEHFFASVAVVMPIIFVLLFGMVAQKRQAFGASTPAIPVLNELALKFALPLALFVGTVTVSRSDLFSDLGLFAGLASALLLCYFIGFGVAKLVFKRTVVSASIAGLAVSCSSGAFYGPAVLDSMYGTSGNVAVSMFAISFNVFVMPLASIIINVGRAKEQGEHGSKASLIASSFVDSVFKTPFVWAPILACILVLCGITMPSVVISSLELLGNTTAGIAVFVAGMTIATNKFAFSTEIVTIAVLKNLIAPVIFCVIAVFVLNMSPGTQLFNEGMILAALPTAPLVVLLATKYGQYQREASSILAISTFSMVLTLTLFVMLANQ